MLYLIIIIILLLLLLLLKSLHIETVLHTLCPDIQAPPLCGLAPPTSCGFPPCTLCVSWISPFSVSDSARLTQCPAALPPHVLFYAHSMIILLCLVKCSNLHQSGHILCYGNKRHYNFQWLIKRSFYPFYTSLCVDHTCPSLGRSE